MAESEGIEISELSRNIRLAIEAIGIDQVIEDFGMDRIIDSIGFDKLIKEYGLKKIIDSLSPTERKQLQQILEYN